MNVLVRECYLYPVKSCAGVMVDRLDFDESGQIAGDREWVIVDERNCMTWMGAVPRLALLRPQRTAGGWALRSPSNETVPLPPAGEGSPCVVQAWNEKRAAFDALDGCDAGDALATLVSEAAGRTLRVVWLATQQHRPNPVHLTTGPSLRALAAHLGVSAEAARGHRRFRPNVVLEAAAGETLDTFAEERVAEFTHTSASTPLVLDVSGRCARCIVIDVDPHTAEKDARYFAGTRQHSARRSPGEPAYFGVYARARHPGRLAVGDVLAAELRG